MKISKAFFFFNLSCIINYLIIPCLCTNNAEIPSINPEENALKELDGNIEKKKKKERIILYSVLGTALALAASAALGFGYRKWRKSKKEKEETKPLKPHKKAKPVEPHEETKTLEPHEETKTLEPHEETKPLEPHKETIPLEPHKEAKPLEPHKETKPLEPYKDSWKHFLFDVEELHGLPLYNIECVKPKYRNLYVSEENFHDEINNYTKRLIPFWKKLGNIPILKKIGRIEGEIAAYEEHHNKPLMVPNGIRQVINNVMKTCEGK